MRLAEPYWEFWQHTIDPPREAEQQALAARALGLERRLRQLGVTLRLWGTGIRVTHAPLPAPQPQGRDSRAK